MVVSLHDHQNTLTHIEGKSGGLQFCSSKTLTIIEFNVVVVGYESLKHLPMMMSGTD